MTQIVGGTAAGSIPGTNTRLDAGQLTLSGPAASNLSSTALPEANDIYQLAIKGQGSPINGTIVGGAYTLAAVGGADVAAFQTSVNLSPTLTVTGGLPSVVNRNEGLTVFWTGGNPSDRVEVGGLAAMTATNGLLTGAEFTCYTTAGAQTLTVSPSILNQLPAISAAAIAAGTATGSLAVSSFLNLTPGNGLFNAPLTAGGSIVNATFVGSYGTGDTATFQ